MAASVVLREVLCKSALSKTKIPGYDYCLNPYVGCTHACIYCYASFMCRFSGHTEKWGRFLDVKVNFPDVLAKQLSGRRTHPAGQVLIGTVTDAYQPAEARYEITRKSLRVLADYEHLAVDLLTKSALVQRDISLLRELRSCEVGFTITTLDHAVARIIEPNASPPRLRLAAARQLLEADLSVWVFIAPLLPGLTDTDEALATLLKELHDAGVREILLDCLNPYPLVVHNLQAAYRRHFPAALPALQEYLRQPGAYRDELAVRIRQASDLTGCHPAFV